VQKDNRRENLTKEGIIKKKRIIKITKIRENTTQNKEKIMEKRESNTEKRESTMEKKENTIMKEKRKT
jgi:hypothetical protein